VSACGQTAAFPLPVQSCGRTACVSMPKFCLLLLSEAVRQLGAAFSVPHRFVDAVNSGFRRPYPYALSAARLSFRYPSFMAHHDWARR